jgi:hypothetical protein
MGTGHTKGIDGDDAEKPLVKWASRSLAGQSRRAVDAALG